MTQHESPRLNVKLDESKGILLTSGQSLTVSDVTFANAVLTSGDQPGNESKVAMALLVVVTTLQEGRSVSYRALIKQESIAAFWLG